MADNEEVKNEDKKYLNLTVRNQMGEDVQFKGPRASQVQVKQGITALATLNVFACLLQSSSRPSLARYSMPMQQRRECRATGKLSMLCHSSAAPVSCDLLPALCHLNIVTMRLTKELSWSEGPCIWFTATDHHSR